MPQRFQTTPIAARTKGDVARLRRSGLIPISLQHRGEETLHLQTETKPLDDFIRLHGEAILIELALDDGRTQAALVHGVQRDAVTKKLIQVTLQKVAQGDRAHVHVPLTFHGVPTAVKEGTAVLQHSVEQVEIECDPTTMPDHITVEVGDLTFGHTLRVSDLPTVSAYTITTPADTVLVSLISTLTGDQEAAPTTVNTADAHTDGFAAAPGMPHESTEPAAE